MTTQVDRQPRRHLRKANLLVRHVTELSYGGDVIEEHSEIRKCPIDTGLQRVVMSKLEVEPQAVLNEHRDYFGNRVHHLDVFEPHSRLRIVAESVVETSHAIACGPESAPDDRPWQERWAEYLAPSPFVPDLPHYGSIAHGVQLELPVDQFAAALEEMGGQLKDRFRYDPTLTEVDSSPEVFFEKGGGVCQDFTHVAIGVLRRAGIPARYASGYLYDPSLDPSGFAGNSPNPALITADRDFTLMGTAASHAWVQAWHPELGWVGLDPTNDKLVDWQYVRVAIGRDYGDVRPVRGVYRGSPTQRLDVSVDVHRLA